MPPLGRRMYCFDGEWVNRQPPPGGERRPKIVVEIEAGRWSNEAFAINARVQYGGTASLTV